MADRAMATKALASSRSGIFKRALLEDALPRAETAPAQWVSLIGPTNRSSGSRRRSDGMIAAMSRTR